MAIRSSAPETSSLVFTDHIENVPEEYRQVGTSILMENDKGQTRSFIVTRMDDKTLTVDGNNPLCGREVVFTLEILTVRDATDEGDKSGRGDRCGGGYRPITHETHIASMTALAIPASRQKVTYERREKTHPQSS